MTAQRHEPAHDSCGALRSQRCASRGSLMRRSRGALLDRVTAAVASSPPGDRRASGMRTLRQAPGYGWSVVIAALPADGLAAFHRLEGMDDPDVAWITRENVKGRLRRLLPNGA